MINQRQFRLPNLCAGRPSTATPTRPSPTALDIAVGGETFELYHDRGETDDATWVWSPERKVVFAGDMFIWASPNCGNPQKVQRYARDWAAAFRKMDALAPEILLPGHGLPIVGAARVHQALSEGAELLETLVEQTLALMNEGARSTTSCTPCARPPLLARPYLRPIYDDPEFVVRNIWRLYGGWYDGDPSHLKPAPRRGVAREELAPPRAAPAGLAERAREVAAPGIYGSPVISPSSPRRPLRATRCARRTAWCSGARARRGVDNVEGDLLRGARARVTHEESGIPPSGRLGPRREDRAVRRPRRGRRAREQRGDGGACSPLDC